MTVVGSVSLSILAFLFPDACLSCGEALASDERHLCTLCRDEIAPPSVPVEVSRARASLDASAELYYAVAFHGPARDLVHALKYGGRTSVGSELAALALPAARVLARSGIDLVTPVPLHRVRLRERGFNQSAIIAGALAGSLGVPFARTLERRRATRSQTELSREDRRANVEGAFRACASTCAGKRILLVDDVVTTGATLRSAASALLADGALTVFCLAVEGEV